MNMFKNKVNWGVEVLADILTNSLYTNSAVNNERNTIYTELQETQKQSMETTIEFSHRGVHFQILSLPSLLFMKAYKGHQMGLPILGKISNIYSITRDMIVEYH